MKVAVIMNAGAGSIGQAQCDERAEQVRQAFADAGVEAEVHLCEGARLGDTARKVAERGAVDAVVAAGGDGTVSAVAGALVGGTMPMAVLPLGTLNHFARDIGMPDDLGEAAKAIAAQQLRQVDVGEVNGRCFVNNSSIGLYPEIVLSRDAEQKRRGWGKWRAMLVAAWRVLRRFPLMVVRVVMPDRTMAATTPFVFIGNNEYSMNALTLGQRPRVDGGTLAVYMVRCRGRARMFWLMVRALMQRLDAVEDFEAEAVTEATIGMGRRPRRLRVAMDGEVVTMSSPLHYKTRPGALAVLVPPAAEVEAEIEAAS